MIETPEEGWAVVERFAQAAIPADRAHIKETLARIAALLPDDTLLPAVHTVEVQLVALHHLLAEEIRALISCCRNVRDMMRLHYRTWPDWKGPEKTPPA